MKKHLIAILLASLCVLLTSCGTKNAPNVDTQTDGSTTITDSVTNSDAENDTATDSESNTDSDTTTDSENNTESDTATDSESNTESDTATDSDTGSGGSYSEDELPWL